MGLLKFGLFLVTWIIFCLSKSNAEYNGLQKSESECVDGQDIPQTDPCFKCVCEHGKILCDEIDCQRKKNTTRSGPVAHSLNKKQRPSAKTFKGARRFDINHYDGLQEAVLPINHPTAKPKMSSLYTKDRKVIEHRTPNTSIKLTETREKNILKTFTPDYDGNDDKVVLIIPDGSHFNEDDITEELLKNALSNFEGQSSKTFSPAFQFAHDVSRPLARQPLVFGRPGDKRLLMRPRHFMRNDEFANQNNAIKPFTFTQKGANAVTNLNSNWQSQLNKPGFIAHPPGNKDISIYNPDPSTFGQNNYFRPQQPVIYNDNNSQKFFVDGKVRWKPANDDPDEYQSPKSAYPNKSNNHYNNGQSGHQSQALPQLGSSQYPYNNFNSAQTPNNNNLMFNSAPGGTNYPGNNYPANNYLANNYPANNHPNANQIQQFSIPNLSNNPNFNSMNALPNKFIKNTHNFHNFSFKKKQKQFNKMHFNNNFVSKNKIQKQTIKQLNSKKRRPGKNKKQIMLYLDDDNLQPHPGAGKIPQANGAMLPYPPQNINPNNMFKPSFNTQLSSNLLNYQPFKQPQNGLVPGHNMNQPLNNMAQPPNMPLNNYPPHPNVPPGQLNIAPMRPINKFNYKKHKINIKKLFKKPFGPNNMAKLPQNIPRPNPNPPNNKNKWYSLPKDIFGNQPFPGIIPPADMLHNPKQPFNPNMKNPLQQLPSYQNSAMSAEIKKKRRKKKKNIVVSAEIIPDDNSPKMPKRLVKKIKNILLSYLTKPNANYPKLVPLLAKKVKNILLSTVKNRNSKYPIPPGLANQIKSILLAPQKTPNQNYAEITPEIAKTIKKILVAIFKPLDQENKSQITPKLAKKIKHILLSVPMLPGQDYPEITTNLAKNIKSILLSTKNRHPFYPMMPKKPNSEMPFYNIPTTYPNKHPMTGPFPHKNPFPSGNNYPKKPKPFSQKPRPVNKVPHIMYPDINPITPRYPGSPNRPNKPLPFIPVALPNQPHTYPDYDPKPMMYDYPHITEKPNTNSPIMPVVFNKPQMYPGNEPQPILPNDYPGVPITENSFVPVKLKNEPQMYPSQNPQTPQNIYPNMYKNEPDYDIPQNRPIGDYQQPFYGEPEIIAKPEIHQNFNSPKLPSTENPEEPDGPTEMDENNPPTYSTFEPYSEPQGPKMHKPKKSEKTTQSPEIYDLESEIDTDNTSTPITTPHSYKPKKSSTQMPSMPVNLDGEPEMYPDYKPKPSDAYPEISEKPTPEKPEIPMEYDLEPEIDNTPTPATKPHPYKPKKPSTQMPIMPVNLDGEPEMYPDYKPKPSDDYPAISESPMTDKPQTPETYDLESETDIDETPISYSQSLKLTKPSTEMPMPEAPDNEPETYPDFEPQPTPNEYPEIPDMPKTEKPQIPSDDGTEPEMYVDETPIPKPSSVKPSHQMPKRPVVFDNEPLMYPDFKPQPINNKYPDVTDMPMTPRPKIPSIYGSEPEIYIDETPILKPHSFKPSHQTPKRPVVFADEPQMYPDFKPQPINNQYPDMSMIPKPKIQLYVDEAPIPKPHSFKPSHQKPKRPDVFNDEPQMYPDFRPQPINNQYPDMPMTPKPKFPLYVDETPIPKPHSFKPSHQKPKRPDVFNDEPQMYPDFKPQPINNQYPNMPMTPKPKIQLYVDEAPIPKPHSFKPSHQMPKRPVVFADEPQMYPDFKPQPTNNQYADMPMTPKPKIQFYVDETPIPKPHSFKPSHQKQKRPDVFNDEPQMYPDFKPQPINNQYPDMPMTPKPKIPLYVDETPIPKPHSFKPSHQMPKRPDVFNDEPQIYPDFKPQPINYQYPDIPDMQMTPKPKIQLYVDEAPIPKPYSFKPSHQMPKRPVVFADEPQMYLDSKPRPINNEYPEISDMPTTKQPQMPGVYGTEPDVYIDEIPIPKPHSFKPSHQMPKRPQVFDDEPQGYPDYQPKPLNNQYPDMPQQPVTNKPMSYDLEPEIYIDDTPEPEESPHSFKPQEPTPESPITPVGLGSAPQMYPDNNPEEPKNPQNPINYDNEPEIYIDDTPTPVLNQLRPSTEGPLIPGEEYDNEPKVYPDYEKPEENNPVIPLALNNEPQMYPDYTKPTNQYPDNEPSTDSTVVPAQYDQESETYPDDGMPNNPTLISQEPENESIPQFNHYTNLPQEPTDNNPQRPQEPATYPADDGIPMFNNYPDTTKKPENFNPIPQQYPIDDGSIPAFNHYPDIKKPDTNYPETPEMYPDYNVPTNPPDQPIQNRPQMPQPYNIVPVADTKPKNPKLKQIIIDLKDLLPKQPAFDPQPKNRPPLSIQIIKPNRRPIKKPFNIIPFEYPMWEENMLEKKNRLSKIKYKRPNKLSSIPHMPFAHILELMAENLEESLNIDTKQNMCKLCKLLDCMHPKRPQSHPIQIIDEESDLIEIIHKILAKMQNQFKTENFPQVPFGPNVEIIIPSDLNYNANPLRPLKPGMNSDIEQVIPSFGQANHHGNKMFSFVNKFNTFKSKHKFSNKGLKPPMLPSVIPKITFINNQFTNGNNPFSKGNNPFMIGNNPFLNGKIPFINGENSFLNGKNPFMNGENPFFNGKNPFMHSEIPFLNGKNPFMNRNIPFLNGKNPLINGNIPFMNGENPFLNGKNPFMHSEIPSTNGKNPFMNSNIPFLNGKNSFQNGNNPFLNGKNPFLDGNNPFFNGNNPFMSSNNPFTKGNPLNPSSFIPNMDNFMPFKSKFPNPMFNLPSPVMPMAMEEPMMQKAKSSNFDSFQAPPSNADNLTQPEMLGDGVTDDGLPHFDYFEPPLSDKRHELDFFNYTWRNPESLDGQTDVDPSVNDSQSDSSNNVYDQDGSIQHFDYFKSPAEYDSANSNQANKTANNISNNDAVDSKALNAQRFRSRFLKGMRTDDNDLTYVRQSKGC